jgi:hypothetical protein
VRAVLDLLDLPDVDVAGALCMVQIEGIPLLFKLKMRGIRIDGPKPIARLASRPGSLREVQVERITAALSRHFSPA